jgi:hypothetical protein
MFGKGKEPEETRKLKATDSIENLENRRKELLELVEQTKQAFYNREIDEQQLARTVEKYQQEIMEIDVKLKKLSK